MKPFDPLEYKNLGESIVRAMNEQPIHSLDNLEKFEGAGIYALYYTGDFFSIFPLSPGLIKKISRICSYIYRKSRSRERKERWFC